MSQNVGNNGFVRSNSIEEPSMPHLYGDQHEHKPVKTMIGAAILIVLSVALYEIKAHHPDTQSSAVPLTHNVASSQQ